MSELGIGTDAAEFWNGAAGDHWVRFQEKLDAQLAPFGQAALDALAPHEGERVLDVGCGCGDTVLELRSRVGPTGSVIGLDVSRPMLARAEARSAERGFTNVEFVREDAATYAPSKLFDAVASRFGVMFFADPTAAFGNLRRALAPGLAGDTPDPGGRLAFVCWQPIAVNPWAKVPMDAVLTVVPPLPPAPADSPGPFAFGDPERVRRILAAAGFERVAIAPFEHPMVLGDTVEAAVAYASRIGPSSRLLADLAPDALEAAHTALRSALAPHGPRVALDGAVWIVTATAPR